MATALRPIGHEERLSLVEHLDELRTRLIICVAAIAVSFSLCFWQSDAILDLVNRPLHQTQLNGSRSSDDPLEQSARFDARLGQALSATAPALRGVQSSIDLLARSASLTPAERAQLAERSAQVDTALREIRAAAAAVPRNQQRQPVTLGPAEPFTTTVSVSLYAGILLVLPILLYQAFAFVLPAFNPAERRVAVPVMLMAPLLFLGGVVFAYMLVLPRAIAFLQTFNDDSFDILLQARDYYRFAIILVGGIGVMFEVPLVVMALTRSGIVTTRQLRANRGYVILGIAIVAAIATPTPDPFTMTIAMAPLIVLFEISILLAAWIERGARRRARAEAAEAAASDGEEPDAV